ncbi:hypothetical protein RvY_01667 [Ramazzottius varieornatus]|uniref:SET domain-containing protein n=1 Tax=Ramazzottius varieornatus TaxID=947166 RepID=A0A1D1UN48_RAMVA|nr:hypothetical protein RvY_01667 [Ramazzottius varieornatus]
MEVLRRQVAGLSEQVKAVEASLYSRRTDGKGSSFSDVDLTPYARLTGLIDDLCRAQQVGDGVLSWNREDNFGQLLEWLATSAGSAVSRVTIACTGERGYGVCVTEEIPADDEEPLVKIPLTCCIGPDVRSNFVIGQCISAFPLPDNLKMAAFLMSEASNTEKSRWKAYLKSLPIKHETILHLDAEAVAILQGSLYFDDVIRRFCSVCKHYINCVAAIDLSDKFSKSEKNKFADAFTFNLFRWALDIVMTRGNALPLNPEGQLSNGTTSATVALIPFLDMLNHQQNASKFGVVETRTADGPTSAFCELRLLSGQSLHSGQEVFMNYSALSVKERFLNHGFLTPEEGTLQIPIEVSLVDEDVPELSKESSLSRIVHKVADGRTVLLAEFEPEGEPTQGTLRLLRYVASRQTGETSSTNGFPSLDKPLPPVQEKLPYMLIVKTATALLKRPVPTLSAENLPHSSLQRLCYEQVLLEHRRLQSVLNYCTPKLKSLLNDIVTSSKRVSSSLPQVS